LRASLLFPYNRGLHFQHAVIQKLGNEGFTRVFRQAPVSTQQILHPELYLKGVRPVHVPVPTLSEKRAWKELAQGTVGEFDHAVLLEQYLSASDAAQLAPSWRGGTFALMESKSTKGQVALLYRSEWSDEEAAGRMFEAWKVALRARSKRVFEATTEKPHEIAGKFDHGYFRILLEGKRVTSVEGVATSHDIPRQVN
ncbi:MAG TPA: hypothetical protein VES20_21710, partial [Bryobacteraceae bacterium]|nr:hypothetical protein [Bryobacteraceae bacterium]